MIKLKDIMEGDRDDFFNHHYTGHIASHHYERSEQDGGQSYLGNISKWPKLIDKGIYGSYEVEFRQTGEKNRYVANDENGDIKRLPNGEVVYMTDAEVRAAELPDEDETIAAFVDGKPVGHASNEFGAVGVWVEKKYQKLGIGTDLLEKHLDLRPRIKRGIGKIGQMTDAGVNMTQKYYTKMEKKYGQDWFARMKRGEIKEEVDSNMISIREFLKEDRNASTDRGCLMAMVDKEQCEPLTKFGIKLIPEENLYKVGEEFGRERECHCTIRYGFLPDLNELQLRRTLGNVKPFMITIIGIDMFKNPKEGFDVVKFTVESPALRQLNAYTKQFPNEDKYPDYKPHMTIAYVKPGTFTQVKSGMNIQIPIRRICYSPSKGSKSYFDL